MPNNLQKQVLTLFAIVLGFINSLTAQQYPTNYFGNPLEIPLAAAGTFGELRPNHFHSGLDLKTDGVEGLNVHAVANGYVSRIRVQANGFGHAIYITHPNGYTSVYGHLSKYAPAIAAYVKKIQYQRESFEVDLQLKANEFPVKKGDIIALSGNTGNSGGAHLHFELRDTKTEAIINPQLFGFNVYDKQPPIMQNIMLYAESLGSHVNGRSNPLKLKLKGQNGNYTLENDQPITVYGKIGFAIQTHDKQDGNYNENGIYSISLIIDEKPCYTFTTEKFFFSDTRYINAHVDFEEQQKSKAFFQRCFVLPNNKFGCYKNLVNRGFGNFYDSKIHTIQLIVKDAAGNTSTLTFQIKGNGAPLLENHQLPCSNPFTYSKTNTFATGEVKVVVPQNALFDSLCFEYSASLADKNIYSKIHHVHNSFTPLFLPFTLSIKPQNLPEKLKSKALIAFCNDNGVVTGAVGGKYENGFVTGSPNRFGNFGVAVDTTAPYIKPLNMKANMHLAKEVRFHIGDNLSGVNTYICKIDGKWVLAELDGKTATLSYAFDEHVGKGKHHLILLVADYKGNTRKYEANFTY